ncbi:MAG: DUF177 domain-containing protein [Bacteroidota bacterium]
MILRWIESARAPFLDAPLDVFRVPIDTLSDGVHVEALQPSAADLDLDPEVFSDIDVSLRLDVNDRRILAMFDTRATAQLECDRTLKMYGQPIEGSHAVLFVPPEASSEADGGDDDEVRVLADTDTHLDLTDAVRDTLVLAIPLRHVSPEGEAMEVQTTFGDDSDDSPWSALRALGSDADSDSSSD